MKDKDRILLEILSRHKSEHITVTDVRDQLLTYYNDENLDPADTRRWINGKGALATSGHIICSSSDLI